MIGIRFIINVGSKFTQDGKGGHSEASTAVLRAAPHRQIATHLACLPKTLFWNWLLSSIGGIIGERRQVDGAAATRGWYIQHKDWGRAKWVPNYEKRVPGNIANVVQKDRLDTQWSRQNTPKLPPGADHHQRLWETDHGKKNKTRATAIETLNKREEQQEHPLWRVYWGDWGNGGRNLQNGERRKGIARQGQRGT